VRMFNVKLPRYDPSNKYIEIPEEYKPLEWEHFNNIHQRQNRDEVYLSHVSKVDNVHAHTHEE
jgi:hypothetical protein